MTRQWQPCEPTVVSQAGDLFIFRVHGNLSQVITAAAAAASRRVLSIMHWNQFMNEL